MNTAFSRKSTMLRSLEGIENNFANPVYSSFIDFALKFENPQCVPQVVSNFEKIFSGLRLKVVDQHFAKASENAVQDSKIKLPSWIQNCKTACDWMNENYTLPISTRLATIAYNDNMVAIVSNHDLSDSGFILRAIEHCFDKDILKSPENNSLSEKEQDELLAPIRESIAFKDEMEAAEKNPKLHPYTDCTSYKYDIKDPHFEKSNPAALSYHDEIPAEKMTNYDKKKKRPIHMNELMWTAITISQYAMALNVEKGVPRKQILSLPIIIDSRKFMKDPSKVDWRYCNCVTAANLRAYPKSGMSLLDIFKQFRDDLNWHNPDGFYYWIKHGNFIGNKGEAYPINSSIGPVKLQPPITDFHIQSKTLIDKKAPLNSDYGQGLNVFSYSKITKGQNIYCPTFNFLNTNQLQKNVLVLRESFKHFITEIPLETSFDEALKELTDFQGKLLNYY